jgi:hypothetical protein
MKKTIYGLLMLASLTGLLISLGFNASHSAPLLNLKKGINFKITSLAKAQEMASEDLMTVVNQFKN